MATFGNLISRLKKDLRATGGLRVSDDDIKEAINDAILHYETTRFTFNEGNGDNGLGATITTVAGTPSYEIPVTVLELDEVQYLQDNDQYYLKLWHWRDYMRAISDTASIQGPPSYYAVHGGYLHFYPTPERVTTITLSGLVRLSPYPLTSVGSANGWTTGGLPLIRAHAAWDLSLNRMANPDLAANFALAEGSAFSSLIGKTQALLGTGCAYVPDWDYV